MNRDSKFIKFWIEPYICACGAPLLPQEKADRMCGRCCWARRPKREAQHTFEPSRKMPSLTNGS